MKVLDADMKRMEITAVEVTLPYAPSASKLTSLQPPALERQAGKIDCSHILITHRGNMLTIMAGSISPYSLLPNATKLSDNTSRGEGEAGRVLYTKPEKY